ncbi:hypothetical protein BCON_0105g00030 [Botryotinia convoluta]|uniref:Uncharacterized protein n=1 Tax=Botryotinia convoluta TaxID=54673 RepID=A0A4Z1ICL1_9HELO|nr:hypothetical protein BCON_0105g00030 [Botryotinia convoluta]
MIVQSSPLSFQSVTIATEPMTTMTAQMNILVSTTSSVRDAMKWVTRQPSAKLLGVPSAAFWDMTRKVVPKSSVSSCPQWVVKYCATCGGKDHMERKCPQSKSRATLPKVVVSNTLKFSAELDELYDDLELELEVKEDIVEEVNAGEGAVDGTEEDVAVGEEANDSVVDDGAWGGEANGGGWNTGADAGAGNPSTGSTW